MKKFLLSLVLVLSSISTSFAGEKITIMASEVPHSIILKAAKPILEKRGIELDIKVASDFIIPNLAVDDGAADANYFQHIPYLKEFNKNKGTKIVQVTPIHIEPMGIYSKKIKDLSELPANSKVSLPNDPTNESRALDLLEKAGLIKLENNPLKTPLDIIDNPKNLQFVEIEAPNVPRTLDDVAIAVINTNYALSAGFSPLEDALVREGNESPYVNVLAVKEGNENLEKIKILAEVINSDEIREFILKTFNGAIVPAF